MKFDVKQIDGFSTIIAFLNAQISQRAASQTVSVINLQDEGVVNHNLDSDELSAVFLKGKRVQQGFDFEPINKSQIKIYLPILSEEENTFTGKVFLTKIA